MKFQQLELNKTIIEQTEKEGFDELTPIQEQCIPEIIKGNDVVGQAETGSGKTLAFCLPILDKIEHKGGIQTLVITPTRELCVQVSDEFIKFGKDLGIKTTSIYGGVSLEPQARKLRNTEVVVGTPGRLLDHLRRGNIDFRNLRFLVLDETDKMFDMGFIDDIEDIIRQIPRKRQNLMFSATISGQIHNIMKRHLNHPKIIKTKSLVDESKLDQVYYDIYNQNSKFSLLLHLLKNNTHGLAIVFCATRKEADVVAKNLKKQGVQASAIHGGMSQNKRLESLDKLKNQNTDVLVATDVAARGLDIKNVTHIYHYDVPATSTEYIHRIGRTARAGEKGSAVTLLTERDHDNFRKVQSNEKLVIEKADMPKFETVPFNRRVEERNRGRGRKRNNNYNRSSNNRSSNNRSSNKRR